MGVDHRESVCAAYTHERLLRESKLVVDTRDALRSVPGDKSKVVRL
jgi:hypothetical protein